MPRKTLYGAAAKAHAKKKARENRRRAARRNAAKRRNKRKNPIKVRKAGRSGGLVRYKSKTAKRWRKTKSARSHAAKKGWETRKRRAAAKKRKATSKRRKSTTKRKSTTRRKTTTKRKTMAKRKSTKRRSMTKAARSRAAKKGWRTRKRKASSRRRRRKSTKRASARRSYRRIRRRGTNLRRKSRRKLTKRRGRGVKTLRRARRTIKYQKAYGGSSARAFMRRYGMRSNGVGAIIDVLKRAAPVAASLYGTRYVAKKLVPRIPGLDRLGRHAAPVGAGLLLGAGLFLTRKWGRGTSANIKKKMLRQDILIGMGLNVLDVALTTYLPESVKAQIGLSGADGIYDSMGEYIELGDYHRAPPLSEPTMGEYIEVGVEEELGLEEELGEYIGLGVEEELGAYAEMGAEYGPASQIGTGIGSNWGPAPPQAGGLLKPIPRRAFAAPVPERSFVKKIGKAGPGFDSMNRLYTGIFGGGFGC